MKTLHSLGLAWSLLPLIKFNRGLIAFSIARLSILVDSFHDSPPGHPGGYHIYHSLLRFPPEKIWKISRFSLFSRRWIQGAGKVENTRKCTDANRVKFAESSSKNGNLINWIPGIMSPPFLPHPSMEIELLNRGILFAHCRKISFEHFATKAIFFLCIFLVCVCYKISPPENYFLNDVGIAPTYPSDHTNTMNFCGKSCLYKAEAKMDVKRESRQMHMAYWSPHEIVMCGVGGE